MVLQQVGQERRQGSATQPSGDIAQLLVQDRLLGACRTINYCLGGTSARHVFFGDKPLEQLLNCSIACRPAAGVQSVHELTHRSLMQVPQSVQDP